MREIIIGKTRIAYDIRESFRAKKKSIKLSPGKVEVIVPMNTENAIITEFVNKNKKWIFTKRFEIENSVKALISSKPSRFRTGAKIPYRGRMVKLFVTYGDYENIDIFYKNGFYIKAPQETSEDEISIIIEEWMKERIKKDCISFANKYGRKLDLKYRGVRIKDQKHLWGSLSKDKTININRHLVFAPKKVLEYVVAHEVCHLRYRNHSSKFWNLLNSVFAEVDACKVWLDNMHVY